MATVVRIAAWDVDHRLSELGLTRHELLEVVKACASAHGGCTDNDPPNAKGYESWRWGVRHLRELYRQQGWEKDDTGNYPTIIHRERKIRVAMMNADEGTGIPDRVPQNKTRKGSNSERAATVNSWTLPLPGSDDWPLNHQEGSSDDLDTYTTWHLCVYIKCVYINGDKVRAELSMLNEFDEGFFTNVFEKIILLSPGEWEKLDFRSDDDDSGPEYKIEISRK